MTAVTIVSVTRTYWTDRDVLRATSSTASLAFMNRKAARDYCEAIGHYDPYSGRWFGEYDTERGHGAVIAQVEGHVRLGPIPPDMLLPVPEEAT